MKAVAPFLLGVVLFSFLAGASALADDVASYCEKSLRALPGESDPATLKKACGEIKVLDSCYSQNKTPVFHFDSPAQKKDHKKVLVFSLVHGDELQSGGIARQWMTRLTQIDSRSEWRIVPILNPDGLAKNSRTNANGVDLNRNFPTHDWEKTALEYWKGKRHQDPRRYPGQAAASEPETQCAIRHIQEFKPDFIISVHAPYGVLDFDGPTVAFPKFNGLPWVSLGTFPGSLGRYMWVDNKTPVLTIELKNGEILKQLHQVDFLQDVAGTLAIRAGNKLYKQAQNSSNL